MFSAVRRFPRLLDEAAGRRRAIPGREDPGGERRSTMKDRAPDDTLTRCEYCGAEYEMGEPEPPPRALRPRPKPTDDPVAQAEPPTHCEWCGVEYPVPGEDSTS
jgi:hypothetical protein